MTQDQVSAILGQLDRLETKVDAKADKADIARLEAKVDKTNGRVTGLEQREIVHQTKESTEDGIKRTIWKASLAIVTSVAALTAIAVAVIDHV